MKIDLRSAIVPVFALVLSGCSINPAPRDFGHPTTSIVEHILIETRLAIIREARDQLLASGRPDAAALAGRLPCDAQFYRDFKPARELDEEGRRFYAEYINVGIGLDFTLQATEIDSASTTIDFLRLISNGTASLELSAANSLTRDSTRSFLVSRTFHNLLTDERLAKTCGRFADLPNFEYPISGSVGIFDTIHTFIALNEGHEIRVRKDSPDVYSNRLAFTTTVSGSANPRVVLAPPTRPFHLTMAALNTSASRTDLNILAIGLAFPIKSQTAPDRRRSPRLVNPVLATTLSTAFARSDTTGAEDSAIAAIQQQRNNLYLDRVGNLPLR